MMKLILSLTLIWMLSSTDGALQCFNGQTYSQCKSNDLCATVAIIGKQQLKSCVPSSTCNQTISYSYETFTAHVYCCDTDLCNREDKPYPGVQSENSLKCFACENAQSSVCNITVQCVGNQNHCMSGRVEKGNHTEKVLGCASNKMHELPPVLSPIKSDTSKFTYCGTSFCNSAWTIKQSVFPLLLGLILLIV